MTKKLFTVLLAFSLILGGALFVFSISNVGDTFTATIGGHSTTFEVLSTGIPPTVEITSLTMTSAGTLNIPATINDQNVDYTITSIGARSIGSYGLESVVIPDTVTDIGDGAFDNCSSLTSVIIPDSVTDIGSYAFSRCMNLEDITNYAAIPQDITGLGVFNNTNVGNVTLNIPKGKTQDYINAGWTGFGTYIEMLGVGDTFNVLLNGCTSTFKILSIGINPTVELTKVVLPSSYTSIDIPPTVTYQNVEYTVTGLGLSPNPNLSGCFSNCFYLQSITIPDTITHINNAVFGDCRNLNNITIPNCSKYRHGSFRGL